MALTILIVYPTSKEDGIKKEDNMVVDSQIMMPLYVFIQDKNAAATGDCSSTKRVLHSVPKTTSYADTSLKFLFENELAAYGTYRSVSISNGVAKVMLESDRTANGAPISSLSSCQSTHLMSVLTNTLLQYQTIQAVEIHTPTGVVEF